MGKPGYRRAFSLLEIILSLAILAGAVAVLSEVASNGLRQARIARDLSHAQLLCESKLAEIAAGLVPAETQAESHFTEEEDSAAADWFYSIDVASAGETDLLSVRVTVRHQRNEQRSPVEFSLVQWMVDPELEMSTSGTSSSSSSTSGSSTSEAGTSGTGGGS
jgi:general secretion pathway protein I